MESLILGVLLSVAVSVSSPYLERKYKMSSGQIKVAIIVFFSVALAVIKKVYGDELIRSFIEVIGSASAFYQYINKNLNQTIETYVDKKFYN